MGTVPERLPRRRAAPQVARAGPSQKRKARLLRCGGALIASPRAAGRAEALPLASLVVAGAPGLEPGVADLESAGLPLTDTPVLGFAIVALVQCQVAVCTQHIALCDFVQDGLLSPSILDHVCDSLHLVYRIAMMKMKAIWIRLATKQTVVLSFDAVEPLLQRILAPPLS